MLPTQDLPPPVSRESKGQIPARIDRYEIVGCLGTGGMGTVYKARDPQLNRVVALKVPRFDGPSERLVLRVQRFQREARAAACLRHPHVCPIYDVGEHEGQPYVVMAYLEGDSLAKQLAGQGRYEDSRQAVDVIRQMPDALEAIHSHGIIHRDLKPSNVVFDAVGQAILTDFGLARSMEDTEGLTSEGVVVGTPAYMAPEQAAGQIDHVGPWTDLYSLGVILYQMLACRLPFEGPALKIMAQILHDSPPLPSSLRPDLEPALEAIIVKAMAREPQNRFQSAQEFKEILARWPASASPNKVPGSDPPGEIQQLRPPALSPESRTPKFSFATKPRRLPVMVLSAIVLFAAVLGGIALYRLAFTPGSLGQSSGSSGPSQNPPVKNPAITRENYAKIKPGMNSWDVCDILGPGKVLQNHYYEVEKFTATTLVWRSGGKVITVEFIDDKVAKKTEEGLYRE
jgi:serine/threonine protein kinase